MMYLFAANHDCEVWSPPLNTTVEDSELGGNGSTGTSRVARLAGSGAGSADTSIFWVSARGGPTGAGIATDADGLGPAELVFAAA